MIPMTENPARVARPYTDDELTRGPSRSGMTVGSLPTAINIGDMGTLAGVGRWERGAVSANVHEKKVGRKGLK